MEGFLAEIRLFAGDFAPKNWQFCNGQLLAIRTNTALFSLVGVAYGGDGRNTFSLPDFRGRMPIGVGQGNGLAEYVIGQQEGEETFVLAASHMPLHNHAMTGSVNINGKATAGDLDSPQLGYPSTVPGSNLYSTTNNGTAMPNMQHNINTGFVGASAPVTALQPSLGLSLIICTAGVFPQRT